MLSGFNWGFAALVGIALVFVGNVLRTRRTGNVRCLGHFFVRGSDMTRVELVLNRTGILTFATGVVLALVL